MVKRRKVSKNGTNSKKGKPKTRGASKRKGPGKKRRTTTSPSNSTMDGLSAEERDAYSRQIAAFGVEMMLRLKTMDVLVVGLQGVGMEAAKNLVLSGPRSLTIFDPTVCTVADQGSNFFLSDEELAKGRSRDVAVVQQLRELNPRVTVRSLYRYEETEAELDAVDAGASAAPAEAPEKELLRKLPLPGSGNLTEEIMSAFSVVLFAGNAHSRAELLKWNRFCRSFKAEKKDQFGQVTRVPQPIGFVTVATFGAMGYFFSDYGDNHSVFDGDGEPNAMRAVTHISNDEKGIVTIDDQGDMFESMYEDDHTGWISLSGVKGMKAADGSDINNVPLWKFCGPVQVTVRESKTTTIDGQRKEVIVEKKSRHPYKILIGDTTQFSEYVSGGTLTLKKKPVVHHYKSFEDSLRKPNLEMCDYAKFGRQEQLHIAVQAVYDFQQEHKRLPTATDIDAVMAMAKDFNGSMAAMQKRMGFEAALAVDEIDEKVLANVVRYAAVELQPLGTFFGGLVAQEVMKWTGKFTPLNQMMIMDAFEVLADELPTDLVPLGTSESRYAHQLAMFGEAFVNKVQNSSTFMIGCGALGCEYLKNFAMMGLGTGKQGAIHVTDNDRIEVSNLNRQFLFRSHNVGHMKSEAARIAITAMNPNINVIPRTDFVAPHTQNIFHDDFWMPLDWVTNALDNVKARAYVDQRCVQYTKALFESGTQGTKCNSQVILPHKSLTYNDGPRDNAQGGIPMCTLRNFPNLITHCVEWARAAFTDEFDEPFVDAKKFVSDPQGFLATVIEEAVENPAEKLEQLQALLNTVTKAQGMTFERCVYEAWTLLHAQFRDKILDLTHQYPREHKDKSGAAFWSGHKRFPRAVSWDPRKAMVTSFVVAVANILAVCYGLQPPPITAKNYIPKDSPWRNMQHVAGLVPKSYAPWVYSGESAAADEEEMKRLAEEKKNAVSLDDVKAAAAKLRAVDIAGLKFEPADFEKDLDANFHIDFIAAATNLRAWNYDIDTCTRDEAKVIAGKIIPAILTATSSITGLMCLEMYKYIHANKKLDAFRDSSNNLGTNLYAFSEPTEMLTNKERSEAQRRVDSAQKCIKGELARENGAREDRLAEFQARLESAQQELKIARPAIPEGFSKWDHTVVEDTGLTVADAVSKFADFATSVSGSVAAMRIGAVTLFDRSFERAYADVAPGLWRRLHDPNEHAFLRHQVTLELERHEVGKANNARWGAVLLRDACAASLGETSGASRQAEVSLSFVGKSGKEILLPTGMVKWQAGKGASPAPPSAEAKEALRLMSGGGAKGKAKMGLSGPALERVVKELAAFAKSPPNGVSIVAGTSLEKCQATIIGPEASPYAGGVFRLSYHFPSDYPASPPQVTMLTPIFHCNVDKVGHLCGVPLLSKDGWSPACKAGDVLLAIASLLAGPNWGEPLQADIASLHERDPTKHDEQARAITLRHAMPEVDFDGSSYKALAEEVDGDSSTTSSATALSDEVVSAALKTIDFEDENGDDATVVSFKALDPERVERYSKVFPEMLTGHCSAVVVTGGVEHVVVVRGDGSATHITLEDVISMEELSPTQLVEYRFSSNEAWQLSKLSAPSLDGYKASKFSLWEQDLSPRKPNFCAATFMRMMKTGLVVNIYDAPIFPEHEHDRANWEVKDKSGRTRHVPHPVSELRIWDAEKQAYAPMSPRLGGAPTSDKEEEFWQGKLDQLRKDCADMHLSLAGDFVADCINLPAADVKKKHAAIF